MTCRSKYLFFSPSGPIPQNLAKTFDGPPTLERSGSEHRRAVTSPLPEEEGLGEKVELLGRKWSSPCRRDGEVEKTPSLTVRKVSVPCKGNRKGCKDY